jgi:xylulokinase
VGNKRLRAGFTNLSLTTSTADLIRAVMEGVAVNSAWLFGYVEKFTGQRLNPIRLLGGGAQSALWCQIYADTLDRDVEQVPQPLLAQVRGVALLASAALGRRHLEDVASHPSGVLFHPSPEVTEIYRRKVRQLPTLYARDRRWSRRHGSTTSRP